MKSEDEESLKRLLLQAGLKPPTPAFTEKVMQQIEAEAAQSRAFEPQLKGLLQRHMLAVPAEDFTQQVMSQTVPSKTKYEPLIPVKIWWALAAAMVLLIGIGQLFPKEPQSDLYLLEGIYQSLPELSSLISGIPTVYVLGLGVVCVLLTADYFLRYKLLKVS